MPVTITAVHPLDAWYLCRDELIGLTGEIGSRITSTGDKWYGFTFIYRGQMIEMAYCQFEKTATAEK
jgi:hypothetical protein